MKSLTLTTTILAAATTALASPLPPFHPIPPNQATCTVDTTPGHAAGIYHQTHEIHIGRPFADGSGCQSIHDRLASAASNLEEWTCVDDGLGMTKLVFRTGEAGISAANIAVVDVLQEGYPMVPFRERGICLAVTTPRPSGWDARVSD